MKRSVTRIEPLWQLLDEHYPGDRDETRAFAIDDLFTEIVEMAGDASNLIGWR